MPKDVAQHQGDASRSLDERPAPENTVRFAIPNACTECHTDKTPAWAVDTLAKWWPNGRRRKLVARAEAFTGGRAGAPKRLIG